MSEYVEREQEDYEPEPVQADFHLVHPPELLDDSARKMYDSLREANQWLPAPDQVTSGDDLTLAFGINRMATLTLTVYINLPEDFHDRAQA